MINLKILVKSIFIMSGLILISGIGFVLLLWPILLVGLIGPNASALLLLIYWFSALFVGGTIMIYYEEKKKRGY